jgi:hypothetical protein
MISLVHVCQRKLQKMLRVDRGAVQKRGIQENLGTTKIDLEARRKKSEAGIGIEVVSLEEALLGMDGAGQAATPKKGTGGTSVAAGLEGVGVVRVESDRGAL